MITSCTTQYEGMVSSGLGPKAGAWPHLIRYPHPGDATGPSGRLFPSARMPLATFFKCGREPVCGAGTHLPCSPAASPDGDPGCYRAVSRLVPQQVKGPDVDIVGDMRNHAQIINKYVPPYLNNQSIYLSIYLGGFN